MTSLRLPLPRTRFRRITSQAVTAMAALFFGWAALSADEPSSVTGDRGLKFVRIEPVEYKRGFDSDDRRQRHFDRTHKYSNKQNFKFEVPAHRVVLSQPFEIGAFEVTVGQFRKFVEATGYKTDAERNGGALGCFPEEKDYVDRFHKSKEITWRNPGFEQSEDHPVVAVSWRDAVQYCKWLTTESGLTHRLPSEAEWEFACRGNSNGWYTWGEAPELAYEYANVADAALEVAQPGTTKFQRAVRLKKGEGDGYVFTAPVGTFKPNSLGIHDMHGNVWEWCQDRWSADVYERFFDGVARQDRDDVVVRDPVFLNETDQHKYGDWRSMRGGAWTCAPAAVRSSIRTFAEAGDASVYIGFRVVRELP